MRSFHARTLDLARTDLDRLPFRALPLSFRDPSYPRYPCWKRQYRGPITVDERIARGKAARAEVPRSRHAEYEAPHDRADPVDLLDDRRGRAYPSSCRSGTAGCSSRRSRFIAAPPKIMAHDLAGTPRSGLTVQACGDAHLSNFGVFASPERRLVFDINDFDETLPGPWEWDVKRLAASMIIAARDNGFAAKDQDKIVLDTVGEYRTAMRTFAGMNNLEVWYAHLEIRSSWTNSGRRSNAVR